MGISRFEERLERGVEGFFGRVFRSGLKPVELGRKLQREMDQRRTVGVSGNVVVPNAFTFTISTEDHEQLVDMINRLRHDLAEAAREHARDEGYRFPGPVEVDIEAETGLRAGMFRLASRYKESDVAVGTLVLPDGTRVPLGEYVVTVGRHPDSTLVMADPNVSRRHAEIRPSGDGYVVVDLGSTNGTSIGGARVRERLLADGDDIRFGTTTVRFEAS